MNQDIHNFIQYLHQEKQTSENTEVSYERDLKKMILYLTTHGVDRIDAVTPEVLNSYVIELLDGRKVLFPAIPSCILDVDLEKGIMTVHVMAGLID